MRDKSRKTRNVKLRFGERLSREEGTIIKDWGGRLPFALIYPNAYYLGMSNLGIHTIYNLLNSYREVVCERAFPEEGDKNPPLSLEGQRPLTDFAILAFSVSYELDYFNIVSILKASGLPLYAADRDERHPLIIAGGPCITTNPMPVAPFFDCLCIGEAEPILPKMLPVLLEGIGGRRDELLKAIQAIRGSARVTTENPEASLQALEKYAKDVLEVPVKDEGIVININTPDEYARRRAAPEARKKDAHAQED
jgi:radical SAM superfamily enzyme YgiQ (UPF0313 family)